MKISIGTKIRKGPWGGGNLFAINLKNLPICNINLLPYKERLNSTFIVPLFNDQTLQSFPLNMGQIPTLENIRGSFLNNKFLLTLLISLHSFSIL